MIKPRSDLYDFVRKERKEIPKDEWIVINDALPALISFEYYKQLQEILDIRAKRSQK